MAGNDSHLSAIEDYRWMQGSCIRCKAIDSWCKLYTLLWLDEHRGQRLSGRQLGEHLYQSDEGLLSSLLVELCQAGFLVEVDRQFELSDAPDVTACLSYLKQHFVDPRARQRLIERIREVEACDRNLSHDN